MCKDTVVCLITSKIFRNFPVNIMMSVAVSTYKSASVALYRLPNSQPYKNCRSALYGCLMAPSNKKANVHCAVCFMAMMLSFVRLLYFYGAVTYSATHY
jgi:hypothetical protein